MKIKIPALFLALLLIGITNAFSELYIRAALCENKINPLGIDLNKIRFSWEIVSKESTPFQTAYQLVISSSKKRLDSQNFDVYNSFCTRHRT